MGTAVTLRSDQGAVFLPLLNSASTAGTNPQLAAAGLPPAPAELSLMKVDVAGGREGRKRESCFSQRATKAWDRGELPWLCCCPSGGRLAALRAVQVPHSSFKHFLVTSVENEIPVPEIPFLYLFLLCYIPQPPRAQPAHNTFGSNCLHSDNTGCFWSPWSVGGCVS